MDRKTGICRDGTTNDVAEAARLMDALPNQAACGAFIYPMDVDRTMADVAVVRGILENSEKHLQMQPYQGRNMKFIMEMLEAVSGSKSENRERSPISVVVAPTSPLQFARNEVEVLIAAAENRIPMITASTPVCGVSGPITLAGMAVLQHAENLAAMAVHQIINPGAPLFYAPRASMMDMRTANAAWGPVEFSMMNLVWLQLGRRCNFAVDSMTCTTDSKTTDEQSGIEKGLGLLASCLGGPDILGGFGMLETINTASFEQLVIDDELMGMARRFREGIAVTPDTLALELIQTVGPGGQYLDQEHTMRFYRENHYLPTLFDRNVRGTWENNGSKDVVQVAKLRVDKLLTEHTAPPLEDKVLQELERIWQAATKHEPSP
jgi:trimethylamine--corrinoid protein Co-methyltransferase